MDEGLALSPGLQGKDVDLEIQGVNVRKVFTSTSRHVVSHESEERKSSTPCEM